jgi:hypothetical protein
MVNEERYQRIGRMRKAVQVQNYAALAEEAEHMMYVPRGGGLAGTKQGTRWIWVAL